MPATTAAAGREKPQPACLGYLDVLHDAVYGYTGGLLVVSASGRPLEFHCTTPLAPTRAQQILFGPTLHPHVCGELIGPSLLAAARLTPTAVLVQDTAATPQGFASPVLAVNQSADNPGEGISVDGVRLALLSPHGEDLANAHRLLQTLSGHVAIEEPFDRVREAIREAQRLSSNGGAHDAAA